jgi:hypothetical protein
LVESREFEKAADDVMRSAAERQFGARSSHGFDVIHTMPLCLEVFWVRWRSEACERRRIRRWSAKYRSADALKPMSDLVLMQVVTR